jgi:WD40 repeat protein
LSELTFSEFVELVVRQDVRPERPDDEDAPHLSDPVWELAESCWVKDPKSRPTASALCDTLSHLVDTTLSLVPSHPASIPSSTTSFIQPPSTPRLYVSIQPTLPLTGLPPFIPPLNTTIEHRSDLSLSPPANLTLRGHLANVLCAAFSPDGKYIVSGSLDQTTMVWDARTGNTALGPLRNSDCVQCVAFSLDGRRITSGSSDGAVLVWDAVTGKVVAGPFKGHTDYIRSVSFSPDGKRIASGSDDNTIRVWNAWTGDLLLGPLTGHTNQIRTVTFSMDSKVLASGSYDKTIRVWSAESGCLVNGPLKGHKASIYFVAFSLSGERIVSVDWYGNVCVWDTYNGTLVSGRSKRHAEGILAVAFTPSSSLFRAVSPDGKWIVLVPFRDRGRTTVQIWDSRTGLLAATYAEHTDNIHSVSFSPDSKQILTASDDKTIHIHTLNC